MAMSAETMQRIVDQALGDPGFLRRLVQDPESANRDYDLELAAEDVAALREMAGSSEQEIVETLQARISHGGLRT